jgi:hypothetical protein
MSKSPAFDFTFRIADQQDTILEIPRVFQSQPPGQTLKVPALSRGPFRDKALVIGEDQGNQRPSCIKPILEPERSAIAQRFCRDFP